MTHQTDLREQEEFSFALVYGVDPVAKYCLVSMVSVEGTIQAKVFRDKDQ